MLTHHGSGRRTRMGTADSSMVNVRLQSVYAAHLDAGTVDEAHRVHGPA